MSEIKQLIIGPYIEIIKCPSYISNKKICVGSNKHIVTQDANFCHICGYEVVDSKRKIINVLDDLLAKEHLYTVCVIDKDVEKNIIYPDQNKIPYSLKNYYLFKNNFNDFVLELNNQTLNAIFEDFRDEYKNFLNISLLGNDIEFEIKYGLIYHTY